MVKLREKLKRHFALTKKEVMAFAVACVFIGFFYAFRNWGTTDQVDIGYGISMTFLTIIIVAFSLFAQLVMQRIMALELGYQPIYELNFVVLLIGLMITVLTNGVIAPSIGGWQVYMSIPRYRLGKWPPDYNTVPIAWVAASGLFLNLLLAIFGKAMYLGFPNIFWQKFIIINLGLAIFGVLPIPFNPGMHILYGSILTLTFCAAVIASASFLIYFTDFFLLSVILPLIIGVTACAAYFWKSKYAKYKGR